MEENPDVVTPEVTDAATAETPAAQTADAPPADASAQGAEPNPAEQPQPQKAPWYNRRIAEEAERRRRAEQELAELRARMEQQPEGQPPAQDIDRLVEAKARQIAEQQVLQQKAAQVYQAGKQAFGDYDTAVQTLSSAMGEAVQRPEFLDTVFDLPNGHAVIHHLGTDLEAANEILSLPPLKMARRLEKLADALEAKKTVPRPVNAAPEPIRPVGASTSGSKDQSKWGPAEWDKYYQERRQNR
jgi:hypothetical protein